MLMGHNKVVVDIFYYYCDNIILQGFLELSPNGKNIVHSLITFGLLLWKE